MSETKTPAQPASPAAQKLITELKVSGHLMTLEAGLFCIFNPPGSTAQDPVTGLPGVRVSLPPGPAFRPEAISITSFRDDGYLGGPNGAALVRVNKGPAQILVTIYQAPNSKAEAPKIQVLRLTDMPAAAAAVPAPVPAAEPAEAAPPAPQAATPASEAEIVAHIQSRGDVLATIEDWMGVPGSGNWIEGFAVAPKKLIGVADVEYQAVLGRGWLSPWADGGQYCGSRGMSLPILGLRVRLRGEAAEKFDLALSASFVDGTQVGPLDNGEPCQAESLSPLEAFRIDLKPRGAAVAKAPTAKTMKSKAAAKPAPAPEPEAAAPVNSPAKSKKR